MVEQSKPINVFFFSQLQIILDEEQNLIITKSGDNQYYKSIPKAAINPESIQYSKVFLEEALSMLSKMIILDYGELALNLLFQNIGKELQKIEDNPPASKELFN